MGSFVCGIDIGKTSVKVVILRKDGFIIARGNTLIPLPKEEGKKRTQDPNVWFECVEMSLRDSINKLKESGGDASEIEAICIDATSGTIVPVDENMNPVEEGILFEDCRAKEESVYLNEIASDYIEALGYKFNTLFSLPKILYIKNNYPQVWKNTKYFLHQADFIVYKFIQRGKKILTDSSNALKTGYDIINSCWPRYIHELGIHEKLPEVLSVGEIIGNISPYWVMELGFSKDLVFVAGMTDSVASCVASGARNDGDMNTILGSTITWKLLTDRIIGDKSGRIYSHKHPSGCFLPGSVGNSGGHGIKNMLNATPQELFYYSTSVKLENPTDCFAYPLPNMGERFPFLDGGFEPFITNINCKGKELYQALIEGAAFIERLGYEYMSSLGAYIGGDIWTTGGGAMVDLWMKIRASVLNRSVYRAKFPEAAYGVAMVAAMRVWYDGDFSKTSESYIIESSKFEPDPILSEKYDNRYKGFIDIVEEMRMKNKNVY